MFTTGYNQYQSVTPRGAPLSRQKLYNAPFIFDQQPLILDNPVKIQTQSYQYLNKQHKSMLVELIFYRKSHFWYRIAMFLKHLALLNIFLVQIYEKQHTTTVMFIKQQKLYVQSSSSYNLKYQLRLNVFLSSLQTQFTFSIAFSHVSAMQ